MRARSLLLAAMVLLLSGCSIDSILNPTSTQPGSDASGTAPPNASGLIGSGDETSSRPSGGTGHRDQEPRPRDQ